nr:immunoglobulin light chain junction region [Macaca mulatta]MOY00838.1 immunoglobulin light chain junction region [Macaca mulatta]MOY04397.1 immunoglobulin light chain junction region [Macaca mulatta]
CMHSLEFPWTF